MQALRDRVFVVTGAGGALAGAVVRALGEAGAQLALVDHDAAHVEARARECNALAHGADLRDAQAAQRMVATVVERFGRVDGLVHTVGAFAMGSVVDSDVALYDKMFDANVRTLFHVVRAVVPGMLARGAGFVCGISSEPGWSGRAPGSALYGAAKSAATTLLRSLNDEARNTQLAVSIVYPMGVIDTPANRRDMPHSDPQTWIDPQEIAATIVHAASRGPRGRLSELPVYPPR